MEKIWKPKDEVVLNGTVYLPFINLQDPNHPQNHGKKYFEVKTKKHPDGSIEKSIWIDGYHLDYSIDISDYWKACKMGYKKSAQESIIKYFTEAVSDIVGRKVTIKEIIDAHVTSWI